jgi:DNA adenine methylase
MPATYTPLRYPGGKNALAGFLRDVIKANGLRNPNYVEPYCGGAGAALNLLMCEVVSDVYLNDIDAAVYSFWRFSVTEPEEICDRIESVRLTVKEWDRQKLRLESRRPTRDLAFAALYLNRVNRSGILRGGVIGGRDQTGPWKMDARFNREDLIAKVRRIARYGDRIHVSRMDAVKFLRRMAAKLTTPSFFYLDPPYVQKGQSLYENHYDESDHAEIARCLRGELMHPWVVSYDQCPTVTRLYAGLQRVGYRLNYSAHHDNRSGREIIVFGPNVVPPKHRSPSKARLSGVRLASAAAYRRTA